MTKSELKDIIRECLYESGIINEWLFSSNKHSNSSSSNSLYHTSHKKLSIGSFIDIILGGRSTPEAVRFYASSMVHPREKDDTIIIDNRYKGIVNNKVFYIYKCNNIRNAGNYYTGNAEEEVFTGTLKEAFEKYNIPYEIKSLASSNRKTIYTKAISIAKSVIADAMKLPEYDECYGVINKNIDLYKDSYEDFINEIEIMLLLFIII